MSYFNTNKPHSYVMQSTKLYKKAAGHLNWEGGGGREGAPRRNPDIFIKAV